MQCPDCGEKRTTRQVRGLHDHVLCDECKSRARAAVTARYRDKHRQELQAKGRDYQTLRRRTDPEFAESQRERIRILTRLEPEYLREIRQRSYWKHVESRRERRREHQVRHRMVIYERDGGRCHICGVDVPLDEFEIDHIVPVSRGGTSDPMNLSTSHRDCNRRKATRLMAEISHG